MRQTKFVALAVFFMALLTAVSSCDSAEWQLKKAVKDANKDLPEDIGAGLTLQRAELDGDYVVWTVKCDEDTYNIDLFQALGDMMKEAMLTALTSTDDEDMNELVDLCIEADKGIRFDFVGSSSGKKMSIDVPSYELKGGDGSPSLAEEEIIGEPAEEPVDNEAALQAAVKQTQNELPMDLGSGIVMTEMYVAGDYVVYEYSCDEDVLDIDLLKAMKKETKEEIKKGLTDGSDPSIPVFLNLVANAEKGIRYRYIGASSGKTCNIEFTPAEVKAL